MSALSTWISQMIILVFVMMITTMLLPEKKMKKYAQFSLALIFLYFFIQPIRQLYTINISRESTQIIDSIIGELPKEDLTKSVDLKKSEIETSSAAYVVEELANQIRHELEKDFIKEFDYQLEEVIIIAENTNQLDFEQINFHFKVSDKGDQIKEIQPVIINASKSTEEMDTKAKEMEYVMISWLSERLNVNLGQVRIIWEEG